MSFTPYENKKVPPFRDRLPEIEKLRRRGYIPVTLWDSLWYEQSGRKLWAKTGFTIPLTGLRIVVMRDGPSMERNGRE